MPVPQNDSLVLSKYIITTFNYIYHEKRRNGNLLIIRVIDTFSVLKQEYLLCYDFKNPIEIFKISGFENNNKEYQEIVFSVLEINNFLGRTIDSSDIRVLKNINWLKKHRELNKIIKAVAY